MHVACPDDQVEAARGQHALGIFVEVRAQPFDREAALECRAAPAVERYARDVERGDPIALRGEIERVAPSAAGDVERSPAPQTRQPVRQQRGWVGATFVCAVTITRVPFVAFGGAHASEAYHYLAEKV